MPHVSQGIGLVDNSTMTEGPPLIQWRDYYSGVGDRQIDEQHQKVIYMINWLYTEFRHHRT